MKKNDLITLAAALIYKLTHYRGELTEEEKQADYVLFSKALASRKKKKVSKRFENQTASS